MLHLDLAFELPKVLRQPSVRHWPRESPPALHPPSQEKLAGHSTDDAEHGVPLLYCFGVQVKFCASIRSAHHRYTVEEFCVSSTLQRLMSKKITTVPINMLFRA